MRRLIRVTGLVAVAVSALAGCSSSTNNTASRYAAVPAPAVGLTAGGLSGPITVGVIESGSSAAGEGQDDAKLAAGAQLAAYRFSLAGAKVSLDVRNDDGTAAGATAAVKALVADGVVGIVMATHGSHIAAALQAAKAAGVAVLLPYAGSIPAAAVASPPGAFVTGPTDAQVVTAIHSALAARGLTAPLVIDAGGTAPTGLAGAAHTVAVTPGPQLTAQTVSALAGVVSRHEDAVVVWGPAAAEADVVAVVEQQGITAPVLLGPSALSPGFAGELSSLASTKGGATLNRGVFTVGLDSTDTAKTVGMQSFLAAVRLASAAPTTLPVTEQALDGGTPVTADTRSHDAVVALVHAAIAAKATTASAVLAALRSLSLTAADGVAGPSLDFAAPTAVASTDVTLLESTAQDDGLRGAPAAGTLSWFAVPSAAA